MGKWFSRVQIENAARKGIQDAYDNFMPDNGQTYVNGSYSRRPYWDYEVRGVKEEAWENTMRNLNEGSEQ